MYKMKANVIITKIKDNKFDVTKYSEIFKGNVRKTIENPISHILALLRFLKDTILMRITHF